MRYRLRRLTQYTEPDAYNTGGNIDITIPRPSLYLGIGVAFNPFQDSRHSEYVPAYQNGREISLPQIVADNFETLFTAAGNIDLSDYEISGVIQVTSEVLPSGWEVPPEGSGIDISSQANTIYCYVLERIEESN